MDPPPPPPPPDTSHAAAGPDPLLGTSNCRPSYEEMILAAIKALKSAGGSSSKMAISNYVQNTYRNLPPNHSVLLTHHLRSLKLSGRIVVSRNSYELPAAEASSSSPRKGRPLKPKAASDDCAPELSQTENDAEAKPRKPGRCRGRPAKSENSRPVEEAAALLNEAAGLKRARGRPPKVTMVPFASEGAGAWAATEPRDQPKVETGHVKKLPVRRSRRPPRPTATTVAPEDRPESSGPSSAAAVPQMHGFEYEILRKKVKIIQTRIKDAITVLKPRLIGKGSGNVMSAITELEAIAQMDIT